MNRRMWIGGLFLSLCGWASQAGAQVVIWRPVVRPGDAPPPTRFQALPAAGASIGRPLPAAAAQPTLVAAAQPAPAPVALPSPPPASAGASTGVIAASFRAALPKPVPRVLPNDLDGLELSGPTDAAPLPTPGNAAVSPAPVAAAIPPAPLDTAIASPPPPEDDHAAAVHDAEPALLKVPEPIAAAPQSGPAPAEAVPALVALPPAKAAPPAVESAPAEAGNDLFPNGASRKPRFYARGEYLLWSVTKDTAPPLVTTSTNPFDFGILGARTTQVLFGGDGLDGGARSGARFTAGMWLDDCDTKGIEVSGFFLGDKSETFNATSAQFPVLARPFFSLNRNAEFVQLTAFENDATGSVAVRDTSDLWGVEANARCCLCCGQRCADDCGRCGWDYRVDGLAGFRYLDLREDLSISENITNFPTPQNRLTNLGLKVFDDFATHNQFYGAQVGLDGTVDLGRWSLNALGKVALGDTAQEVSIHGSQLRTNLDGTVTPALGGLLALPSNIGTFHKNAFTVVPEVDLTVSYHVSDHVRVFAGYDVLFWSSVVRPGQQIDRTLDETQIPNFEAPGTVPPAGQNRPAVLFQRSDLWAQGLNLGLEFRY